MTTFSDDQLAEMERPSHMPPGNAAPRFIDDERELSRLDGLLDMLVESSTPNWQIIIGVGTFCLAFIALGAAIYEFTLAFNVPELMGAAK